MNSGVLKSISTLSLALFCCIHLVLAKLNIITSIPDLADIVTEIGGDSIAVFSLATGEEDMHSIQAKSSFLPKINRADLVICLGLQAESSWLSPIVDASRNDRVKKGSPGWIEAYKGMDILEKPTAAVTTHVGGHPLGNPHINEGPYSGIFMAKNIYDAFVSLDKKNQPYFQSRLQSYDVKLKDMEERLKKMAAPLAGVHVISYHADLAYFCHFYGMTVTGCLEPSPGVAPNAKHLMKLVSDAQRDAVKLVLYHQAQSSRLPEKIAERTGAQTVCFANMVHSRKEINTFIELQEYNLKLMLDALNHKGGK